MHRQDFSMSVDYTKAFGIFLVVFGHVIRGLFSSRILPGNSFWVDVDKAIYLFHMPLFFFVAALFFKASVEKYGLCGLIRKNAYLLLLPMAIWSYLQFSLQYLAAGNANSDVNLTDVLTAPFPPRQQFWFIGSIFITMIIVALVMTMKNANTYLKLILISGVIINSIIWSYLFDQWIVGPVSYILIQTVVHLPFFIAGLFLKEWIENHQKFSLWFLSVLFLLAISCYLLAGSLIDPIRTITSFVCVISTVLFFCEIARRWTQHGFLSTSMRFIGMNSMIIYLSHIVFTGGMRTILSKLEINDPYIHVMAGTIVGIMCPLFLVWGAIKAGPYAPMLVDVVVPHRTQRQ